jgi:hypoxanthine phosphoribosyltransferase
MSDLYLSWDEYHHTIEQLAVQIETSAWKFDQILCLARGGLRVGDTLARMFHKPLAILATSSYRGDEERERGKLTIAQHITMTTPTLGAHLLLVDDLVDSGITIAQTISWLQEHHPEVKVIKTAVLWYKACSIYTPDYYAAYLPDNPWIHQPFE